MDWNSWLTAILRRAILLGLAGLGIAFAVTLALVLTSDRFQTMVGAALGAPDMGTAINRAMLDIHPEDAGTPEASDRRTIVRRVLVCRGAASSTGMMDIPFPMRGFYTENPRLLFSYPGSKNSPNELRNSLSQAASPPSMQEQTVLELSRNIFNQRVRLREKVEASYRLWQWTVWITIGLGLATTVLVSLSTSEFGKGDNPRHAAIRILAIVFPALGTAAAAIVAFYAPQAEWAQSSRSQAALSLLHNQIAFELWKHPCPDDLDGDDKRAAATQKLKDQIQIWSTRYTDLQAIGTPGSQANSGSQADPGTNQAPPDGPRSN